MTYKVTFENNVPKEVVEAKDGVVQKKFITENGVNIYDWVLVDAETEEAALLKARDIEQKVNDEQT